MTGKWIVYVLIVVVLGVIVGWVVLHTTPTETMLRDDLLAADRLELVTIKEMERGDQVTITDPAGLQELAGAIRFEHTFWKFSPPPYEATLIEAWAGDDRLSAWEVRGDGAIHKLKGARWYRMGCAGPVDDVVLGLLEAKGVTPAWGRPVLPEAEAPAATDEEPAGPEPPSENEAAEPEADQ